MRIPVKPEEAARNLPRTGGDAMNVNIEPIVVERIYEAPVSAVWEPSRTVRRCAGGTSRR